MMTLLYALLGLLVGAFLNLCADQLPKWRRLRRQPFCPYCEQPRPPWAWISALAFLRFKHSCQHCGAPISWRHLLVELGTAALYALLWHHYARPGQEPYLLLYTLYTTIFVLVTVIDLEHRLILNVVIYPAWLLAFLGSFVHPSPDFYKRALLGGALGFLILYAVYLGGVAFVKVMSRARGQPIHAVAFGFGDVRLGLFIGLVLGFPEVLSAILYAILLGGVSGLLIMLVRAAVLRRHSWFMAIPYGPFLVIGALLEIFVL